MYFNSDHYHFSRFILKYTLIFTTECVNKFVIYFYVLVSELAVIHTESNVLMLTV